MISKCLFVNTDHERVGKEQKEKKIEILKYLALKYELEVHIFIFDHYFQMWCFMNIL